MPLLPVVMTPWIKGRFACKMAPAVGHRIQIVGGGLAGLALGIELRLHDVSVTVWEAGRYPRHRVCGEVLSGRGCTVLARLGLLDPILAAGGRLAQTAGFFAGKRMPIFNLPETAVCVSRHTLDALLAARFRSLGGDLREGERWNEPRLAEGFVRAAGRPVQAVENGWRWFGVKAHCQGARLVADIEMHLLPSGYVGLCQLSEGRTNVCGLFRRRQHGSPAPATPLEWLQGPEGSTLHNRLRTVEWVPQSVCAVAGLPLSPRRALDSSECQVGDAITMTPPVTGNGMSMALESAQLSAGVLTEFSRGVMSWETARDRIARACDRQFTRRLNAARWLHRCLFYSAGRRVLAVAGLSSWVWRRMFHLTR